MTFLLVSLVYLTGAVLYAFLVARYVNGSVERNVMLSCFYIYPFVLLVAAVIRIAEGMLWLERSLGPLQQWWVKLCRRGRPE